MNEILRADEIKIAKQASRKIERDWRVVSNPHLYSPEEVNDSLEALSLQQLNLGVAKQVEHEEIDPEFYNLIFMGMLHWSNPPRPPREEHSQAS